MTENTNQPASSLTAELIVQQLIDNDVNFVALSPGSRNGPISLALIQAEKMGLIKVGVRIDERSAAYLALGAAIASGKPSAVLTTSGTAVANLFPAVVEAKYSGIPLIVLSADRPASVQGTGANQVIVQREIFGNYVSRSIEVASESLNIETNSAREAIKDRINSVISIASKNRVPVHLNITLGEPLVPTQKFKFSKAKMVSSTNTNFSENILTEYLGKKGVIVAGGTNLEYLNYAKDLSNSLDWPVIVEPPHACVGENMISNSSVVLGLKKNELKPEVVLTIGRVGLSRQVSELIKNSPTVVSCALPNVITNSTAKQKISGLFRVPVKQQNQNWLKLWKDSGLIIFEKIQEILKNNSKLSNLHVVNYLIQNLPKDSHIHLSSSYAARDFDLLISPFYQSAFSKGEVSVSMNRGANGIDGVVSTAIGASLVNKKPTFAFLGDIAAIHDLNSFVIPKLEKTPDITFIISDNNGGGIFNTLEQSGVEDFERVYGTPTNIDLAQLFNNLNIEVLEVNNINELSNLISKPSGMKAIIVKIESRETE
ncbi:MAG: 2-succinyl-5-enolpyruvyl-6-hydroxy-3-cyclohexene-1-carboxylic-acid synthase, partial [Candidatus Nanopelagicales bacterium]